jgi:histidine triad (HIT) family protein
MDTSNMTPEQIMAEQKKNCIFCHIANGRVESKKVYEDDKCTAVLDIAPAARGHIVVIPKNHYSILPQMPDDEIGHVFTVAKHLSQALLKGLGVKGTNIFVANGAVAGQKTPHFLFHVIPRKEKDNLNFTLPQNAANPGDQKKIQKMLLEKLKDSLGMAEDQVNKLLSPRDVQQHDADQQDLGKDLQADSDQEEQGQQEQDKNQSGSGDAGEKNKQEQSEEGEKSPEEDAQPGQASDDDEDAGKQNESEDKMDLDKISGLFK